MKKFITITLAVLMVLSLSVTAFAAAGFISSPEANEAPVLVSAVVDSKDCKAEFEITSYGKRTELSADDKQNIEQAYEGIKTASADLSTLNADLAKLAKKRGVAGKNLAVSDLFNIGIENCADATHSAHGKTTIKLKADTLNNFVGLMRYSGGKWELVSDAKVSGDTLTFKTTGFDAFAFVVSREALSPETGDVSIYMLFAAMAVSAAAAFVCVKKYRAA